MRLPILALLCAVTTGCASPSQPETAAAPLTWTGTFGEGPSLPGHVTLLLDEAGDRWSGTMFYETLPGERGTTARATYRIEGTSETSEGEGEGETGALVHIEQKEMLDGDPLPAGTVWCLGSYDLALGAGRDAMVGGYEDKDQGCSGTARLLPAE